jgi:hypothetical protein
MCILSVKELVFSAKFQAFINSPAKRVVDEAGVDYKNFGYFEFLRFFENFD